MFKTFETELAGRKLVLETGKMAGLANGSVLVRYGETVVIVNVTASKEPRDGIDFFPLSVDYEEKLYSVGKIPGSFTKREGKPSDKAILTSRAIDRPLRPLFPKDFRNDVVVVATVLCVDQDNSPEVAAMIGASAALSISDIPFGGPTAAVKVGYVDGKIVEETFFNEDYVNSQTYGGELDFTEDCGPYKLGKDEYFLMGDNRNASKDSRDMGYFNAKDILSKYAYIVYPIENFNIVTSGN